MVSVIVPVYNVEKYLCQCLDSVLNQTYTDFEMILIDDGSTDASGKICDDYAQKDSRITVIHKENGGQSIARNMGIDAARGEYIYFLDSDDYIREDALEKLVFTANETGADIVFFERYMYRDGSSEPAKKLNRNRVKDYGTASGIDMIFELQRNRDLYLGVPYYFVKKNFLDKHDLYFYPAAIHEDDLFTVTSFIKAEKITHLYEELYFRRVRPNSIITRKYSAKHFHDRRVIFQKFFSEYMKGSENSKERDFLGLYLSSFYSSDVVSKYYLKLDKEEKEKARSDLESIKQLLESVGYFGNKYLKFNINYKLPIQGFLSQHPRLYSLYNRAIKPAKTLRDLKRKRSL